MILGTNGSFTAVYSLHPDKWLKSGAPLHTELCPYLKQLGITHVLFDSSDCGECFCDLAEKLRSEGIEVLSKGGLGSVEQGVYQDLISYISVDPYFRKGIHGILEDAVRGCTADSVIPFGGSGETAVSRAYGSYDEKFANLRLIYTFMTFLGGKKLIFMGDELAPFNAWDGASEPQWFMADFERHRQIRLFVSRLFGFCHASDKMSGELRMLFSDADTNTVILSRCSENGELIAAFNFSPIDRQGIFHGTLSGSYREVFSSSTVEFGGTVRLNADTVSDPVIPGLSAMIFESVPPIKIM